MYPVFLTLSIEETVLSWFYVLSSFFRNYWSYMHECISGLSIMLHWSIHLFFCCCCCYCLCTFFLPLLTILFTIAFSRVWNQKVWCLKICSSFSRLFWLFGNFVVTWNFRISSYSYEKCPWNFCRNWIESVDCFS